MNTTTLYIRMVYKFFGNTEIDIPNSLLEGKTEEEQLKIAYEYAKDHIDEIPVPNDAEYLPYSDEFEMEDISFKKNPVIHCFKK